MSLTDGERGSEILNHLSKVTTSDRAGMNSCWIHVVIPGRRNHTKGGRENIQGNQSMFAICVSKNTQRKTLFRDYLYW